MDDENSVAIWERKISRRILDPVRGNGMWRMCINQELMNLCREPDIISEIGKRRLRLLGNVEGMPEEIILKKVFKNTQEGESLLQSQEIDG